MVTQQYRVRDGRQMGHNGQVLTAGDLVELPVDVAYEVRHLMQPIGPDGEPTEFETREVVSVETELARAQPHERVSLLEAALETKRADMATLERMLEQAREDEKRTETEIRERHERMHAAQPMTGTGSIGVYDENFKRIEPEGKRSTTGTPKIATGPGGTSSREPDDTIVTSSATPAAGEEDQKPLARTTSQTPREKK